MLIPEFTVYVVVALVLILGWLYSLSSIQIASLRHSLNVEREYSFVLKSAVSDLADSQELLFMSVKDGMEKDDIVEALSVLSYACNELAGATYYEIDYEVDVEDV